MHFVAVLCKTPTGNDQILSFLENVTAKRMTAKFFFRFLCFNTVHSNLGLGQLASIFDVKQIGVIAKELQKQEVIFKNDVLVAKGPYLCSNCVQLLKLFNKLPLFTYRSYSKSCYPVRSFSRSVI